MYFLVFILTLVILLGYSYYLFLGNIFLMSYFKKIAMFLYSFKKYCQFSCCVPFSLLTFQWDGFLYFSMKRILWGVVMRGQGSFSSFQQWDSLLYCYQRTVFLNCGPSVCPLLRLLSEAHLVRRALLTFLHKLALQGHELTIRQWIFLMLPDNCLLGCL